MYDCTVVVAVFSRTQHTQCSETLPLHITLGRRPFTFNTVLAIYNLAALVDIYLPLW